MSNKILCNKCEDTGHVCENHPNLPWEGASNSNKICRCGGAGMPCPNCCIEIPQNGSHSIIETFIPDMDRDAIK